MLDLTGKSILITGGTGSLGKALTATIFKKWPNVKRLVILSRDEQKQFQMAQEYTPEKYPQIRFFIGDVRDEERLRRAFKGIDYVIHAAAMKHVPIAEYNPSECVKTNINGAQNVINAALDTDVSHVVALSTDKAAAPINLYGATKLTSDKLFIAANNIRGRNPIKFSVVRYGNVMGSNGSVIPFFINKKKEGVLPITVESMTRFNISLQGGVDMVLHALETAWGGELFVPKIPSYNILDIAKAIGPECEHRVIGIRPGEKIHEEMITTSDSFFTYDLGKYYAIVPQTPTWSISDFISHFNAKKVPDGFSYNSGNNSEWETVESLRALIVEHVDPDFTV
ncbi:UDP-N-acetylglucosamine 4,6-dehydratase (inverting) [Dyadobacter chenwenxiniae]|uniref:UDP-N-acetylglucosamine 4,6-dehydratase (Inverting) n=1 Tax=Dyadobacter chenwenxiniae TaxID=2906456 RepID=A0A9X1PJT6_9BACT|nr:UDP-N-acetylglucosamine 4,6-dehydratase (inverting) [Dyadobacter chenwenxiniae]MCF0053989.1 UDP-N-acetylglucosamine 4,6-dehydratase (inverting) [Dyadobacter chenwenxiniae]MCF0061289.1 UDP-N-acetylglucosamine 4,6-dehydratase (inverting) [Dyadobacter chenwenxiniae]UON81111.1 UDP-N-acetylglucosamine 4,6-dehydratase (inverting) [Dyadobacter chenwenxiniae]